MGIKLKKTLNERLEPETTCVLFVRITSMQLNFLKTRLNDDFYLIHEEMS